MLARLLHAHGLCGSAAATAAVTAACSAHLQRRWASSSSSAETSKQDSSSPSLTPEQQQHLDTLRYLIARPLEAAQNAAVLTALTASYRDLYVVMDQFHKRDILGIPRPLLDEPPATSSKQQPEQHASGAQQQSSQQQEGVQQLNHTQVLYPLRDLTKLPDEPLPPGGFWRHHLVEEHMINIRAHAQMLPNHLEVNYHIDAFIYLWPPMEMFFPTLLDPGYMLRHLKPHMTRTRVKRSQRKRKVRCSLGWQQTKPYHKQRVFRQPSVPAVLMV